MSAITIPLSKPIKAHGEEINELTFREPTTEDVIDLGLPMLFIPSASGETATELRQKVLASYIARLAAIPMGSVKALSLKDFSRCTGAVMGFFGDGEGEAPTS